MTFGPSDTERRVTIQTNSDNFVEGNEMFTASLVPVSDRVVITQDTADITIEETANGIYFRSLVVMYGLSLYFSQ